MNDYNSSSHFDFHSKYRRLPNPFQLLIAFIPFFTLITNLCTIAKAKEPRPKVLDPVIVSASHLPSTLNATSASTTIITREEIEARQAISVVDLLRQVPGLHIDQAGGRGGVSSVYMRGSDPNFTVVMIDEVKLNDPTNSRGGSFDLSTLDSANIERIEIVRGPLSSVHGSDAMGGVIHIITRSGADNPETIVDVGGGTEEDTRAGFQTRGPLGASVYAFSLSHVDDGSPVEGSGFTGTNIGGKLNITPSNKQRLELSSRYGNSESTSFPDDSGGPAFSVTRDIDQREVAEWSVGLAYGHDISERFEYQFNAAYFLRREEFMSPGVAPGIRDPFGIPPNRSDNHLDRTNVVINTIMRPVSSTRLSLGVEGQFENGKSEGRLSFGGAPVSTSFDLSRDIYSAFLEVNWVGPLGLVLEGGARFDDPEDFDSEVSPRAGLIYRMPSTRTTLKANWGEGFKVPSFFALGHALVGNPALQAETSRSYELSLVQTHMSERIIISASYFNNRFFNLIDLDEGPPPVLVNRSEVHAEGGELTLDLQVNRTLWINNHLTYTETEIVGTAEVLRNRPEWRGGINARWRACTQVQGNVNILYVGKSLDSSIPTGNRTLGDYVRVDLSAAWQFRPYWEFRFALDNVFDTVYEEAVGFSALGIRGRLGLRLML